MAILHLYPTYNVAEIGDYVERDEEIATIETDKVSISLRGPDRGRKEQILMSFHIISD